MKVKLKQLKIDEKADSAIHLGAMEGVISFDYFKGIYNIEGAVFSHTPYPEKDDAVFMIRLEKDREVSLIDNTSYNYVTKEDIESNDEWYIICRSIDDLDRVRVYSSYKELHEKVLQRYYDGETGFIEESEKIYNDVGEYMIEKISFHPKRYYPHMISDLGDAVHFIHKYDPTPWEYREEMTLFANKETYDKILSLGDRYILPASKENVFIIMGVGVHVTIKIQEDLEYFILKKTADV